MTQKIPQIFDNFLDAIQSVLMSFLVKLGPFTVALMPALFTAYAVYYTFEPEAGPKLALFFAMVVGLALETVGIVATHTAIELYNAKDAGLIQPVKFRLMVWLVPVYVVIVALVVGFSKNAFTPLVKGLGIASPFLTCIVYVAVALARDLTRTRTGQTEKVDRQAEIDTEERAYQRQKELLELEHKQAAKLARIAVKRPDNRPNIVQLDGQLDGQLDDGRQSKEDALDAVLVFIADNPDASLSAIGRGIGKSKSSAGNYVNELLLTGKLHKNGEGLEVR